METRDSQAIIHQHTMECAPYDHDVTSSSGLLWSVSFLFLGSIATFSSEGGPGRSPMPPASIAVGVVVGGIAVWLPFPGCVTVLNSEIDRSLHVDKSDVGFVEGVSMDVSIVGPAPPSFVFLIRSSLSGAAGASLPESSEALPAEFDSVEKAVKYRTCPDEIRYSRKYETTAWGKYCFSVPVALHSTFPTSSWPSIYCFAVSRIPSPPAPSATCSSDPPGYAPGKSWLDVDTADNSVGVRDFGDVNSDIVSSAHSCDGVWVLTMSGICVAVLFMYDGGGDVPALPVL